MLLPPCFFTRDCVFTLICTCNFPPHIHFSYRSNCSLVVTSDQRNFFNMFALLPHFLWETFYGFLSAKVQLIVLLLINVLIFAVDLHSLTHNRLSHQRNLLSVGPKLPWDFRLIHSYKPFYFFCVTLYPNKLRLRVRKIMMKWDNVKLSHIIP